MLKKLTEQIEKMSKADQIDLERARQLLDDIHEMEAAYCDLSIKLKDVLKEHNIQCCLCKHYVQHEQRGASYCGKYLQSYVAYNFPECFQKTEEEAHV